MGNVTEQFEKLKRRLNPASTDAVGQGKTIIQVGSATCENAAGAGEVRAEFEKLIKASGRDDIVIKQTGCTGRCAQEPIVGVFSKDKFAVKYQQVTIDKVQAIFHEHVIEGKPVARLMLDKRTDNLYEHMVAFCTSPNCSINRTVSEVFKLKLLKYNIPANSIGIINGGCIGLCSAAEMKAHGVLMV